MRIANMEFQSARSTDAEALAMLRKQIREDTYRNIYPDAMLDEYDIQKNVEGFIAQIESEEQQTYLIYIDKERAGYFSFGKPIYWFPDSANRDELFLNALYLSKRFWRQGIGRAVMQFIFQAGSSQSKQKLYNNCNCHNSNAVAFYRACGGKTVFWECGHENRAEDQMTFEYKINRF